MLKLSASSIGTYEKCPKQYHYRYILKPEIEEKNWDFLEFGLCAHLTLELFHEHLMKNVVDPSKWHIIMRDCFKKAVSKHKRDVLKPQFDELRGVIQDYLNMLKRTGLPPVIDVERNFNFVLNGFRLRGYIDRLDKIGPGEYHVVDYKTNKNPKYLTPFQLKLYALAVKEKHPDAKIIHGSYVLLKHKSRTKDWTFSDEDLQEAIDKIVRVGTDINLGEHWPKKPSILCNWCDYQKICQGEPLDTLDDVGGLNWDDDNLFS